MKPYYTFFISILMVTQLSSQLGWQEHLSHDRIAYAHHGHFINQSGDIYLTMGNYFAPMNTTESIVDNTKKSVLRVHSQYNTYSSKSKRLSIGQNQLTLQEPWDYDIAGNGVYTIFQISASSINFREVLDVGGDQLTINDIIIPIDPFGEKYCTTTENKLYGLDFANDINWIEEFEGILDLHIGLNSISYKIANGVFSSILNPTAGSIELGAYDKLDNDPYQNELIEFEGSTVNRYSFDDYALVRKDTLEGTPIDYLFNVDGFHYLIETQNSFIIYFYSNENSNSVVYYELPKTDGISKFEISEFNLRGNQIFFLGLWRDANIGRKFSYVQKRTHNEAFMPQRKDLEFTSLTATREKIEESYYKYDYEVEVTNVGELPIDHFTIISKKLSEDFSPEQFHKRDIEKSIPPGESYIFEGSYSSFGASEVTFHIIGVDFALDSDESNNSFSTDPIILSSEAVETQIFSISPNPSSEYISILGPVSEIKKITISDLNSRTIQLIVSDFSKIDISNLQNGQYWLQLKTRAGTEHHPFIKI